MPIQIVITGMPGSSAASKPETEEKDWNMPISISF